MPIKRVSEAIIKEGFRLKLKKCTFASNSIKYLGHLIENNTVRPIKDNLISIHNFPTPKTHLRSINYPYPTGVTSK